jgi:hypothetical protein
LVQCICAVYSEDCKATILEIPFVRMLLATSDSNFAALALQRREIETITLESPGWLRNHV